MRYYLTEEDHPDIPQYAEIKLIGPDEEKLDLETFLQMAIVEYKNKQYSVCVSKFMSEKQIDNCILEACKNVEKYNILATNTVNKHY